MSMAESIELTFIKKACENASQKIGQLKKENPNRRKTDVYKNWYDFAGNWIDDVRKTVLETPDPFVDGKGKDWASEFDRKASSLEDDGSLHEETKRDMENLYNKLSKYKSLIKEGNAILLGVIAEGMTDKKKSDKIDYNLLSLLEPIRDVERQMRGSIGFVNTVFMRNGPRYNSMEPELYTKIVELGKEIDRPVTDFAMASHNCADAIKLAKEYKLETKITADERESLLEQALEDAQFEAFANDIEKIVNIKKAGLEGCEYIKVRVRRDHGVGAYSLDGKGRENGEWGNLQFGVEVIARAYDGTASINARADAGSELPIQSQEAYAKIEEAIDKAYEKAERVAQNKIALKKKLSKTAGGMRLAESIDDYKMAKSPVTRATVKVRYDQRPVFTDKEKLLNYTEDISKESMAVDGKVEKNIVWALSNHERGLFIDSDGRRLDQSYVRTEGGFWSAAKEEGKMAYSRYETLGGTGSVKDILEEGKNGEGMNLCDFVVRGTIETANLAGADYFPEVLADGSGKLKVYEKDGKLFTDGTIIPTGREPQHDTKHKVIVEPAAGWLIVHETSPLSGHGGELNRGRGHRNNSSGYTIYANFNKTKFGEQVASSLITTYFNPRHEGSIDYRLFDDEGTPTREVIVVDKGIAKSGMASRSTAHVFGMPEATGCTTSIDPNRKEMERMSFNSIKPGTTPYEKMVEMMDGEEGGYILETIDIPAINAGRTAAHFGMGTVIPVMHGKKVYDDRTGKPLVYRGVGIMYDVNGFWNKDMMAVGDKVKEKMCANCGNADGNEMQAKKMSHEQPPLLTKVYMTGGTDNFMGYEKMVSSVKGYLKGCGWRVQ